MSATNISIPRRLLATAVLGCSLTAFAGGQSKAEEPNYSVAWVAGGPIWAAGQTQAVCYLFNPSNLLRVNITAEIRAEFGGAVTPVRNTCSTGVLQTGAMCVIVANISSSGAHACEARVYAESRQLYPSGEASIHVRGALEIRNNAGVLNSVELQQTYGN